MERTELKEKRNGWLWGIFMVIYLLGFISFLIFADEKMMADDDYQIIPFMGIPLLFLVYRILTYLFNQFLLLFFRCKKIKLNRLKGRVTPIYKVEQYISYFSVTKYSVHYTNLDLEWSVPFSVLFKEQEYLKDRTYKFNYDLEGITNIGLLWEEEHAKFSLEEVEEIAQKTKEQQKLDNLNKTFNENYK